MSVADIKRPVAKVEAPVAAQIQGRADTVESGRLYGWAWDRARPKERLLIRVLMSGRMVASATADKPRVDLRRNGIGDGNFAFEVELPPSLSGANMRDQMTVIAVSPATGEETVLDTPSNDERAAEAAVAAPLSRVMDQLEVLIAAQRRSQIIQRESVEAMRATAEQVEKMSSQEDGVGAALEMMRGSRDDLTQRISDVEVFLLRFDNVLSELDRRIRDLGNAADRPMRRAVSLLIMLGGVCAVGSVASVLILIRAGLH